MSGRGPYLRAAAKARARRGPSAASEAAFARALRAAFADMADDAAKQIGAALEAEKARRSGGDPVAIELAARRAREAMDALDLEEHFASLLTILEPTLASMAADGAAAALRQLGLDSAEDVVTIAGDRAAAWGRARAAEMVGMRRMDDGSLVPNPNAKWRIDETTRDIVRSTVERALVDGASAQGLADAIVDSAAFSEERALMVARTELAHADSAGAMESYRASGVVAGKQWSTSQDDKVSEPCLECEAAGVIPLDATFPTGVDYPPNHPNCRCVVLPVLEDEMPTAGKVAKSFLDEGDGQMKLNWIGAAHAAFRLGFSITKTEKMEDGRLMVQGIATSEALDGDGEVLDYDSTKAAFTAWAGNIREQHDPKKAVGRAVEVLADDATRSITVKAFISAGAPDTQAKLLDGTLAAFSLGGKVAKRIADSAKSTTGETVAAMRVFVKSLTELSVVDVGSNPDSNGLLVAKADDADEGDVQKGAYTLQSLIGCASELRSIFGSADWERMYGEHSEEVVAELGAALRMVAGVAQRYMAEEMALMLRGIADGKEASAIASDIHKAGRRFSAATKTALKAAHDACRAADKALADLKYDDDAEGEEEPEGEKTIGAAVELVRALGLDPTEGWPDTLRKAAALAEAADQPSTSDITEVAKALALELPEPTQAALSKAMATELIALRAKHEALLASPTAPKGVSKVIAVEKTTDVSGENSGAVAPVEGAPSEGVGEVATLIKAAHRSPVRLVR